MAASVSWGRLIAASGMVAIAYTNRQPAADLHASLDLDGATGVADAAKMFGFVNPCAGKSVDDLSRDLPLFVARAAHDQLPRLNDTLDRFVSGALACNLPLTFANHATAPHAFDLFHDSEASREIIGQMLAFLRFHLLPGSTGAARR